MADARTFIERLGRKYRSVTSHWFARQTKQLPEGRYISFCFDDFPQSAVLTAGPALEKYGWKATWYACGVLMNTHSPVYGKMFTGDDLKQLVAQGQDIGCHTYHHIDCAQASAETLQEEQAYNHAVFHAHGVPQIQSFAFPFGSSTVRSKQLMAKLVPALRGVQTGLNRGRVDLHMLKACGIQQDRGGLTTVRRLLKSLQSGDGWLIIFTHDVRPQPSPWGCSPEAFETLLADVSHSGAEIVTIRDMLARLDRYKC